MPFAIDTDTPFGQRAQRRLREEKVAWLITTSEDGTPQPSPSGSSGIARRRS